MHPLNSRGSRWLARPAANLTTSYYMRRQRGVTMIEYVLMAAIAVALAVILRAQLTSIFQNLLKKIQAQT